MADSEITIANMALTKIGDLRISSWDEGTKQRREVQAIFASQRDYLQRRYNWNFCIYRTNLAADVTAPDWGYSYRYPVPADNLRLLQVGEFYPSPIVAELINAPTAEYAIEGGFILTNQSGPLKIKYLRRITDTASFDPAFDDAFACRIAANVCMALSQSESLLKDCREAYRVAIMEAQAANAIERPPESLQDDTWIAARL